MGDSREIRGEPVVSLGDLVRYSDQFGLPRDESILLRAGIIDDPRIYKLLSTAYMGASDKKSGEDVLDELRAELKRFQGKRDIVRLMYDCVVNNLKDVPDGFSKLLGDENKPFLRQILNMVAMDEEPEKIYKLIKIILDQIERRPGSTSMAPEKRADRSVETRQRKKK